MILHSSVTGACPVTTDLIMRVNVKTTTATTGVVYVAFFFGIFFLLTLAFFFRSVLSAPLSSYPIETF